LADDLARHAREARRRVFRQDMTALEPLKRAMEQALGLHFHDRAGEDFFRSSLTSRPANHSASRLVTEYSAKRQGQRSRNRRRYI
jgi:hypothetical protein